MTDTNSPETPDSGRRRGQAVERLAHLESMDVTVEKLVMGGEGLARYDGIPIFVPRAVPGDRLRVRLVQRKPDYARAEISEVLEPGPGRRQPPCPYFERCGGCDLQQIEDELQPQLKAEAVIETLQRLGRLEMPAPEVVAGAAWGYRLRAQLHAEVSAAGRPEVGYYARGSRELVAIDRCPILVPELEQALGGVAAALPSEPPRRLDLAAGGEGSWTVAPVVEGLPRGSVELKVGDLTYSYDARAFFQSNRSLLPQLIETAVGPWQGDTACDLYAGVGLFTLPLARQYRRVVGVEVDRAAARFARINARHNDLEAIDFVTLHAELALERLRKPYDRLLVDPPRTGLSRKVRQGLLSLRPERLTYVSCDAPTLARDLRQLTEVYRVESWTLLDLFPQTGHMEAVVQLVRSAS